MSLNLLPPPHGPDHEDGCLPCAQDRRTIGHLPPAEVRRQRESGAMTPTGKRPWTDESRWRFGAKKIGISFEEYRTRALAGQKWCSGCRDWHPRSDFGPHKRNGLDSRCRAADRASTRAWMRQKRGAGQ